MDPDKALADIIDAAVAGDPFMLSEHASDLALWLKRGGFAPSDPRKPSAEPETPMTPAEERADREARALGYRGRP
jgi:hypothetical protein